MMPGPIPRIIHRLWINPPGPPMPAEFVEYGRRWRELHPTWSVRDWTSIDELRPLLNQDLYDRAPTRDRHRIRAGLVRLELIYRIGGVYVDTDVEPLKPLDELIANRVCMVALSANRMRTGAGVLSDSFMAGVPGHPLFRAAIEALPTAMRLLRDHPRAAVELGPYHLDRTFRAVPWPDVHVLAPHILYPQSITARERGEVPDLSRSYAWHHWANSRDRKRRTA